MKKYRYKVYFSKKERDDNEPTDIVKMTPREALSFRRKGLILLRLTS